VPAVAGPAESNLIRYHVNVHWEKAPDYRTSRTLDWLNDACEAKLKKNDRADGEITYTALMSPASVSFTCRGTALSFDRKHPFAQANRAKLWLGKGHYVRRFPISLLLTTGRTTRDDDGKVTQIQPYVLLGTKQWLGRFAAVERYEPTDIRICHEVRQVAAIPRVPVRRLTVIRRNLTRRVTAAFRHPVRRLTVIRRNLTRRVTAAFRHPVRRLAVVSRQLTRRVTAAFRRPDPEMVAPSAKPAPQTAAAPRDPARQMANQFQCMIRTGAIDLDIRFPTEYEAKILVEYIESNQKIGLAFMYPKGQSPIGDQPI
jgi:hypothetical protein